jgi:hypothetical protein
MDGFKIITQSNQEIRFTYYVELAPITSESFKSILPFTRVFYHAKVSGQEMWINDVPPLDIVQENASVFTEPGEVVLGHPNPFVLKLQIAWEFIVAKGKVWMPRIFLQELLREIWKS